MEIQNQVRHRLRGNLTGLRDVLDGAVSQGTGRPRAMPRCIRTAPQLR